MTFDIGKSFIRNLVFTGMRKLKSLTFRELAFGCIVCSRVRTKI